MGKTNLHPQELVSVLFIIVLMGNRKSFGRSILKVEWISDKRGTLCCIYMKFSHEKSSPSWHPYRYQVALPKEGINTGVQVTDSTVMRSKQIFFTLSPDGLTQFSLDHTVFIDLKRWLVYEKVKIQTDDEGGYEMQGSTSRWSTSAPLQGFNSKQRTIHTEVLRFRQWKSFRCWRKALSRHKFQSAKQVIQERHFINYADLRKTYCEIQDVLSGISDMGMIEVGPTRTYTLTEFCQEQEDRCKPLHRSFQMR